MGVSSATDFPIHFITYSGGSGAGAFTARDASIGQCSPPVEGGNGIVSTTVTGTVSSASTPSAFTPGDDISVSLSATNGVPGPATISDLDSGATYTINPPYQYGSYLNLSTL